MWIYGSTEQNARSGIRKLNFNVNIECSFLMNMGYENKVL